MLLPPLRERVLNGIPENDNEQTSMHLSVKNRIVVLIGLASIMAWATQAQQQLAKSITDVHVETSRTSQQLANTLKALNGLTAQNKGDLRPAYNAFVTEVGNTKAAADSTHTRVRWMASDGRQYFRDWQHT